MQLVFATHNRNKVREVQKMLDVSVLTFRSLADIGCLEDIPETQATIEGNAVQKARYVFEKYGENCFAEDTGLEIDALEGAPGVYTARYAGEDKDPNANMNLVLAQMQRSTDRTAQFKTVFALIIDGELHTFEGICKGQIATQKQEGQGFGYDPIFIPNGETRSFAEMSAPEKNAISHRGIALKKMLAFLKQ
jgi:XTP/dITP diphosphohydrolase